MSVKVCIVGCGAIGSLFAAHLARLEDVEVHAYDVYQEHVRAINERGLRISGAADFTAHLHATSDASQIPCCEASEVAWRCAVKSAAPLMRRPRSLIARTCSWYTS